MSDTAYPTFQHYGTNAQRLAFTPSPAAGTQPLYTWYETDTGQEYQYTTGWIPRGSGSGSVPIVVTTSQTVQTNTGWVIPESLTINSGVSLTIQTGAIVEVTGVVVPTPAMVLITTTMPSGTNTFTWSSLGSYTHLKVIYSAVCDAGATSALLNMQFNGDVGSNYDRQFVNAVSTTVTANEVLAGTSTSFGVASGGTAAAGDVGVGEVTIADYRNTTFNKSGVAVFQYKTSNASGNFNVRQNAISWRSNAAITSITVSVASGNFVAGSKFSLYGIF